MKRSEINHVHGLVGLLARDESATPESTPESDRTVPPKDPAMSTLTPNAGSLAVIMNQYKGAVPRWHAKTDAMMLPGSRGFTTVSYGIRRNGFAFDDTSGATRPYGSGIVIHRRIDERSHQPRRLRKYHPPPALQRPGRGNRPSAFATHMDGSRPMLSRLLLPSATA